MSRPRLPFPKGRLSLDNVWKDTRQGSMHKSAIVVLGILILLNVAGLIYLLNRPSEEPVPENITIISETATEIEETPEQARLREEVIRRAKQAEEAAKMAAEAALRAEQAAEKERLEREQRLAELNEQLAREAAAREAAESAAQELKAQMQALQEALQQSEIKQRELTARTADLSSTEVDASQTLLLELKNRRESLAKLEAELAALEAKREAALKRQIALEEAILGADGKITIPHYRVWSPNYRPQR